MEENPFLSPASENTDAAAYKQLRGPRKWLGLLLYVCCLVSAAVGTIPVGALLARDAIWRRQIDKPSFRQGVIYFAVFAPITIISGYGGYRLRRKRIDGGDSQGISGIES